MNWAFRGRWLFGWLLVALVAVGFVRLGFWQLDRLQWRRDLNARIESRRDQPPVDLTALAGGSADELEYLAVRAEGTYDPSREVALYGRALNGRAGDQLLTPLHLDDGSVIFVDRGWIPFADADAGALEVRPPAGRVTLEGILLPPESDDDRPDADTVKDVSLVQLAKRVDGRLWPVYLLLRSQDPPQPGDLPVVVAEPELSERNHLSYAFQWFTFATIAVVGWALLLRRESRDRTLAAATDPEPGREEGTSGDVPS